jgi:hypothetical protein
MTDDDRAEAIQIAFELERRQRSEVQPVFPR